MRVDRVGRAERVAQVGVVAGVGAVAALLRTRSLAGLGLPPCPVAAHLGIDCPGCGATRAVTALARGDLAAAVDHNALAMLALPFVVAAFVWWVVPAARRDGVRRVLASPLVPRLLLVAVIAFTVVRNTPLFGGYLAAGA